MNEMALGKVELAGCKLCRVLPFTQTPHSPQFGVQSKLRGRKPVASVSAYFHKSSISPSQFERTRVPEVS